MKIEKYSSKHDLNKILFIDWQSTKDIFECIKNHYNQNDLKNIDLFYLQKNGSFYVGLIDGKIIAMCGYLSVDKDTVELKKFRVEASFRGNGYGSKMLKFIESKITLSGFKKIILDTASNRKLTINFYKKHGYRQNGELIYDNLKCVIFEKEIKKR